LRANLMASISSSEHWDKLASAYSGVIRPPIPDLSDH
jgi:hypothetical protein